MILLVCLAGFAFAFPNFLTREQADDLPSFLPSSQVNLGLDLQGGSHMLLEVDVDAVVAERLEVILDDIRQTLRKERIGYTGLRIQGDQVVFRLRDDAESEKTIDILETLRQPLSNNVIAAISYDTEVEVTDAGLIAMHMSEQGIMERRQNAVQQSIEIVRRRVDEMGTREPSIQRQGDDRVLVQVPGLQDPAQLKAMLNTTAKLSFHLLDETASPTDIERGRVPPGSKILHYTDPAFPPIAVRRRAMVSGENLVDAQPSFNENGVPVVSIRFDIAGARQFGDVTRNNVNRRFAIVLDDEVISAQVINEPILGGQAQISGGFTVQTANDLATLLRAGALPAPLTILEERTVGPELGADSVEAGKTAFLIGLIGVLIFIVLAYGRFGLYANVALVVNIALLLGGLSALSATLTLPGIAGIVLTIGMAVDANVLVFERIREETRLGRTPMAAVDTGYRQAMSTIMDANITTLIAALILFQFGSGPIKGFAVTLTIGILTSVFTAVTLTRFIIAMWLRRARPSELKL